jgi:beta-lactamase regulating signal transducer with metallopeptidase domain
MTHYTPRTPAKSFALLTRLISLVALLIWTALMALAAWLLGLGADFAGYFVAPATDAAQQAVSQAQEAAGVSVFNADQAGVEKNMAAAFGQGLGLLELAGVILLGIIWFVGALILLGLMFFASRIVPLASKLVPYFKNRSSSHGYGTRNFGKRSSLWQRF